MPTSDPEEVVYIDGYPGAAGESPYPEHQAIHKTQDRLETLHVHNDDFLGVIEPPAGSSDSPAKVMIRGRAQVRVTTTYESLAHMLTGVVIMSGRPNTSDSNCHPCHHTSTWWGCH